MVTTPKKTSIIASVLVIFAVVTATSLVSIAVESHQAFAWGGGGWGWGGGGWGWHHHWWHHHWWGGPGWGGPGWGGGGWGW